VETSDFETDEDVRETGSGLSETSSSASDDFELVSSSGETFLVNKDPLQRTRSCYASRVRNADEITAFRDMLSTFDLDARLEVPDATSLTHQLATLRKNTQVIFDVNSHPIGDLPFVEVVVVCMHSSTEVERLCTKTS
jgi:hypothetical protein